MTDLPFPTLVKLSKTDLGLKDPSQDLRGHKVVDNNGDEVGDVDDMLIDENDRRPRFLLVGSGGFLGIGENTVMVPVDKITRIESGVVHVDIHRNHIAKGPRFSAEESGKEDYWVGAYGHYNLLPFWSPGYRAPTWPERR